MAYGADDPTWADIIAEHVRAGCAKIHTSFPAIVVTYDPTTQKATIQPALRARVDDPLLGRERPDVAPMPPIANVPVLWPSGGGPGATWSLHGPLLPGDPVTILIAERSTDEWRAVGAPDNAPLDARRFDLSDAVAIPGGRSFNPASTVGPLGVGAIDPAAVVLSGPLVKLGGSTAFEQVVKGSTFFGTQAPPLGLLGFLTSVAVAVTAPQIAAAAAALLTQYGGATSPPTVPAVPPTSTKILTE